MTKNLLPIDTNSDTWGDVITKINDIIFFASNNAITTGADDNTGDVDLIGNFTANVGTFNSLSSNSTFTANSANLNTIQATTASFANTTSTNLTSDVLTVNVANIKTLNANTFSDIGVVNFSSNTANINYIKINQSANVNTIAGNTATFGSGTFENANVHYVLTANTVSAQTIVSPYLAVVEGANTFVVSANTFANIDISIAARAYSSVKVIAGSGLSGGGTLASDITIGFDANTTASIAKADSAIQNATMVAYAAPIAQAVPKGGTIGQGLVKNSAANNDVKWADTGDMLKSVYDPTSVNADAFDRTKHTGIVPLTGIPTSLQGHAVSTAATTVSWDDVTAEGWYDRLLHGVNNANGPGVANYFYIYNTGYTTGVNKTQIGFVYAQNAASVTGIVMRSYYNTGWLPWLNISSDAALQAIFDARYATAAQGALAATAYQKNNILAAVSQSSGVPTGGIINGGSNANGNYIKLADGTLICTVSATLNAAGGPLPNYTGTGGGSGTFEWTFPAVFAAAPIMLPGSAQDLPSGGLRLVIAGNAALGEITTTFGRGYRIINADGSRANGPANVMAIGRWF